MYTAALAKFIGSPKKLRIFNRQHYKQLTVFPHTKTHRIEFFKGVWGLPQWATVKQPMLVTVHCVFHS